VGRPKKEEGYTVRVEPESGNSGARFYVVAFNNTPRKREFNRNLRSELARKRPHMSYWEISIKVFYCRKTDWVMAGEI
jgi:hypothetical protein